MRKSSLIQQGEEIENHLSEFGIRPDITFVDASKIREYRCSGQRQRFKIKNLT